MEKTSGEASHLGSPGTIWDHLALIGIIWEDSGKNSGKSLRSLWGDSGKSLRGVSEAPADLGSPRTPERSLRSLLGPGKSLRGLWEELRGLGQLWGLQVSEAITATLLN